MIHKTRPALLALTYFVIAVLVCIAWMAFEQKLAQRDDAYNEATDLELRP